MKKWAVVSRHSEHFREIHGTEEAAKLIAGALHEVVPLPEGVECDTHRYRGGKFVRFDRRDEHEAEAVVNEKRRRLNETMWATATDGTVDPALQTQWLAYRLAVSKIDASKPVLTWPTPPTFAA